jgi:acetyl esterase/lipase
MNLKLILLSAILTVTQFSFAQKVIPLYEGPITGAIEAPTYKETVRTDNGLHFIDKVSAPTLTIYLPKVQNGAAVIICPGGGYQTLAIDHEGVDLAKRFNAFGITAFVLKYRLPSALIMKDKTMGPLQDAQQAILRVRKDAKKWNLDPKRIGILGSSAGGHLAATASTHFAESYVPNEQHISLRPDFMVLLYPVISFGAVAHTGSAKKLIGPEMQADKIKIFSNETWVNAESPPTFLLHASDDKVVTVKNSLLFYEALVQKNINAEMHIYRSGGHGFGLNNKTSTDDWFLRLMNWLKDSKLI